MPFDGEVAKFDAQIAPVASVSKLKNPLNLTEQERVKVKNARALIEKGWVKGAEEVRVKQTFRPKLLGLPLPFVLTRTHSSYCLVGALIEAEAWPWVGERFHVYVFKTRDALSLTGFNDDRRREKKEVLALFDEVLA